MTEKHQNQLNLQNHLQNLPEAILHLMDAMNNSGKQESAIIRDFLLSFVNPDMVCNLASMTMLPKSIQSLVIDVFDCFLAGFKIEELIALDALLKGSIGGSLSPTTLH